jgi:hypothetical protein
VVRLGVIGTIAPGVVFAIAGVLALGLIAFGIYGLAAARWAKT